MPAWGNVPRPFSFPVSQGVSFMAAIPGDWHASRSIRDGESYPYGDGTVRFVYATQPNGEKYIVAKVWSGDDGDFASTAQLIAAAPELLAAIKKWMELYSRDIERLAFYKDAISMMQDAITKAEGRTA